MAAERAAQPSKVRITNLNHRAYVGKVLIRKASCVYPVMERHCKAPYIDVRGDPVQRVMFGKLSEEGHMRQVRKHVALRHHRRPLAMPHRPPHIVHRLQMKGYEQVA